MKHLPINLKTLYIVVTLMVFVISNSYLHAQTSTMIDKYGNELVIKSNQLSNSVKRIYRIKAPITRYGITIGQINESNIKQLGQSVIKDYENFLGISSEDLKAFRIKQGRKSTWHLGFRQLYKNVPVWRSFIRFTIESQGVISTISADIHPNIKLSVDPDISEDNAVSAAINAFKEDESDTIVVINKPKLFIYPKIVGESVSYYLTYKLGLHKKHPFMEYLYFINATNGEIVYKESLYIDDSNNNGNVKVGYYPEKSTDSPVDFSNMSGVTVQIKNDIGQTIESGTTNSSGNYNIDWDAAFGAYYL